MSQQFSNRKGLGPEMTTHHHGRSQSRHGSENPDLTEEAQLLLSQFMGRPSQRDIEAEGKVVDDGGHSRYSKPDDSMRVSSPVQRNFTSHRASNVRRQRDQAGSSPKVSTKPLSGAATSPPNTARNPLTTSPKQVSEPKVAAPSAKHRPTYQNHPNPLLPTRNKFHPPTSTRRSGRQKTEPPNYYKKLKLSADSGLESDVNEGAGEPSHASALWRRRDSDIRASLSDARSGHPQRAIEVNDENGSVSCRTVHSSNSLNRLLHGREIGCPLNRQLQTDFMPKLKPSKYWKGASNDVIVLAWSPDGTRFAAGATAQCDQHNIQYNRENNLVIGDLTKNCLKELPDHQINRPGGADPLFMSVTAMQWFDDVLYTSSYDKTVKMWDASQANARCFDTLRHDSNVEVMARSNFDQDILATGTNSIGLWNMKDHKYTPFEVQQKKIMELSPTSLAWGTTQATKNILLAGMSEKDDGVPQTGLLGAWRVDEASVTSFHLTPNSQNIFDIKWHPSIPYFATGNAATSRSPRVKSVVRLYEPLRSKTKSMELDCGALDINDVTFCPKNMNYVTASCTDGITYVWDFRNPDDVLLKLEHGEPLNQIDENLPREQADVGVRMALWGNGADQFYTGASDGVLKRWDILRSQEDVHVQDVTKFQEEIMCGSFSNDKTNLLIGDAAGGVHVLSSGPFSTNEDQRMTFERANETGFEDKTDFGSESGVAIANELLLSGKLLKHRVFGAGKGPHYNGPFADWARPEHMPRDQLLRLPLKEDILARQLDGVPLEHRQGLDEQSRREIAGHIQLATIRNQRQQESKRKRDASSAKTSSFINLCSEEEERPLRLKSKSKSKNKRRIKAEVRARVIHTDPEVIDLTLSDPENEVPLDKTTPGKVKGERRHTPSGRTSHSSDLRGLEEELQEDFWWPTRIDPNIQ